jgi:hypothetical protein
MECGALRAEWPLCPERLWLELGGLGGVIYSRMCCEVLFFGC